MNCKESYRDFLRTVDHYCKDMEALMATELKVSVSKNQTVKELLMKQLRIYTDASYKNSAEKAMESNKKRLDGLLNHMKDEFFPEQVQTRTTTGHVGQDVQPRQAA